MTHNQIKEIAKKMATAHTLDSDFNWADYISENHAGLSIRETYIIVRCYERIFMSNSENYESVTLPENTMVHAI